MEEGLTKFLEYEGGKCYIPNGNGCFLKCNNYLFCKHFSLEFFEFIQAYETRANVMTRCRTPEFCERYKIDFGIFDVNRKRILPRIVKQRDVRVYIQKNQYCVI